MTDKEIDAMVATLRDRTIGAEASIIVNQVLDSRIPAGVKRFLAARLARELEDDLLRRPHMSRVNLGAPGIADLIAMLVKGIVAGYELPRDEFLDLLREAVIFTEKYVTRPQRTFSQSLCDRGQNVSLRTLRSFMEYCAEYAYYGRILENVLLREERQELSPDALRTLIGKIDEEVIRQHSPEEMALLAKPVFDFMLLKDADPDDQIPLAPLLTFLEDKNLTALKHHVVNSCRANAVVTVSLHSLAELLRDLPADIRIAGNAAVASSVHAETPRGNRDDAARSRRIEAGEGESTTVENSPDTLSPEIPDKEAPAAANPSLPDIQSLMDVRQHQRILRRVFRKDRTSFENVVAALNRIDSWEEASTYLAELYRQNRLDPFADDVVTFTDLVQQRYRSVMRDVHEVR
jgi:hypothetical protein